MRSLSGVCHQALQGPVPCHTIRGLAGRLLAGDSEDIMSPLV